MVRNEQPDAVLIELMTPVMDGLDMIQQIRVDPTMHDRCIVAMSAAVDLTEVVRQVAIDSCLVKSFERDDVLAEIAHCPEERNPASIDVVSTHGSGAIE